MALPNLVGSEARYLTRNEHVVVCIRRHWSVLLSPAWPFVVAIIAASLVTPMSGTSIASNALWVVALVLLARFAWYASEWWLERIVVTDKRLFEISGVLTRKVASMPLQKMTDMTYQRPPMARLLGYGNFIFETAGQDQALSSIANIPNPDEFYRTLNDLLFGQAQVFPT